MRRFAMSLSAVLVGQAALATAMSATPASLSEVQGLLAGGWRYEADGSAPPACDPPPSTFGTIITFEFIVTGGRVQWTSENGEGVNLGAGAARDGNAITLTTPDGASLKFGLNDDGTLSGTEMADIASDLTGKQFRKCYEAADRTRIDSSARALAFFGGGAEAPPVRFVDTRFARKGQDLCLEPDAQYLRLDMVGPLGFELALWNSAAIAEKLAIDEAVKVPLDEVSNFTLESLVQTGLGWEATVTELIPPNGSRGDTTTIRLQADGDRLVIPEWQRDYLRCTRGDKTTVVAQ